MLYSLSSDTNKRRKERKVI